MKRITLIVLVCGICCAVQAQVPVIDADGAVTEKLFPSGDPLPLFDAEAVQFDAHLEAPFVLSLRMSTPSSWQQQVIEALRWQHRTASDVAQESVNASVDHEQKQYKRSKRSRDINEEVGQWRISVGNTGVRNWSEFPDRMLDARTLSFPLPKKR